jgi:MraZ protein
LAFRGHFEYSLDAKNRLTIPAKFRAALSGGVVLAKSLEPCVAIWPKDAWDEFTEQVIRPLNPFSPEGRQLQRYFHAGSFDAQLDSAGRIMIPPPLLRHAGLGKEVVVVGNLSQLEVWDRRAWQEWDQAADATATESAQRVASGRQEQ